jgi:MFS family permease
VPKKFIRSQTSVHVRRRDLLRFVDFRRLAIGQYISQTSDAVTSVLIAQFVLFESTTGPTATLLIQSVLTAAIPLLLAGPISGVIADKFSRRIILWYGQFLRAFLITCMLVSGYYGNKGVVLVLFACCMCLTRVLYTARIATIRHLVRQHELVAADSLLLIISNIAGASGGVLGLLVLRYLGLNGLILVAVGHVFAGIIFSRITTKLGGGREHQPTSWKLAADNLASAKTRYAIASTSVHRLLFGIALSTSALYLSSGRAGSYALLIGASGAGSAIGNTTAEWVNERLPRRSIAILTYVSSSLGMWVCFIKPVVYVIAPAIVVLAFLFQNLRVCTDATVQKNATKGAGGRIFAMYDLLSNMSFLIGLLCGLMMMPAIGAAPVFATLIGAFGVWSIVFGLMNRNETNDLQQTHMTSHMPTIDVAFNAGELRLQQNL